MKKLALLMILASLTSSVFSQEVNENAPRKKAERKAREEQKIKETKDLLQNRNFVLESEYLQRRNSIRYPVSSNINFIKVDSTEAVIQIGSNSGFGPNGLGGITAKGHITKWDLKENAKGHGYYLTMSVLTAIGIYDVHMSVGPMGNTVARLNGLQRGELIFDGDLVTLENSSVFEGRSL